MSKPLYEITNDYIRAFDELSAMDDITPQIIEDSLAALEHEFSEKALNVAAYINNLLMEANNMKIYEARMYDRRKVVENKIDNLKEYLKINMIATDALKIKGAEFNLAIGNSEAVNIIQEELIENKYKVVETTVRCDKKAIKEAIKRGEEVQGASLQKSQHLIIK